MDGLKGLAEFANKHFSNNDDKTATERTATKKKEQSLAFVTIDREPAKVHP